MNRQQKILVVEDHLDLAENLAEILAGSGYAPVVAASAEEALRCLDGAEITALLTDYRLPGKSGAELINEVRRRGLEIPALVMSAYTDEETIRTSRRAGAAEVLAKPVEIRKLLSAILGLLQSVSRPLQ